MKIWKTILLQTGIFTSVFALGAGAGFLTNYHRGETKQAAPIQTQAEGDEIPPYVETPTDKFLNNLVNAKALAGDIDLHISPVKESNDEIPSSAKRALTDFSISDIDLSIKNLEVSIADFSNIKVAGDINVKMGNLDITASVKYIDNTIYLDYADTKYYLETSDITDVMGMLPTVGTTLEVPEEFQNLDIDGLTKSLQGMEEVIEDDKHYFIFNFSDDIQINLLSDDEYHMVGVELPGINLMGMNISADSTLRTLDKDIETLVKPADGQYKKFRPAFTLVNDVIDLVNKRSADITLDVDVNKKATVGYSKFISLDGNVDFNINDLKVLADLTVGFNNKDYNVKAAYTDETIYASYKNFNLSITNQSVLSLVKLFEDKIPADALDDVMDKVGSVADEIDIDQILQYVTDLPTYVQNFDLTETSLSLDFDPSYFGLPVQKFNIAIEFDSNSIKSVAISDLCYGEYQINVKLDVDSYKTIEINPANYVAVDPALSLIGTVTDLISSDKFGVEFSVTTDDGDSTTNDLDASGVFHFALRDKTEEEFTSTLIKSHRTFDYGAGELTIHDGDGYPHNLIVDAEPFTISDDAKVLFSYGGTTNHRTNARIDYATFDALVDKVIALFESEDPHVMEIFGDMLKSAEDSPLAVIFASKEPADYLKLLDYDIITSLDITPSEIRVTVNGAILGFEEMNPEITIRYSESSLDGIDITGINLGGKTINFSANLFPFSESEYEKYNLDEDPNTYIDLSTISKLVEEFLNTSEMSYYHMKGTIDFELDSGFLNAIGSLAGNRTMQADLQVNTFNARTKVIAHLTDIPVIPVVSTNYSTGILGECSKESYLLFDNLEESAAHIGTAGLFHIHRHDKWFSWGNKTQDIYSKYETPYMLQNIVPILMGDLLGFGDTILDAVTNIESAGGQIHYENIIQSYEYVKDYSLKNAKYNNNVATTVDKYTFAINIGELAQSDALKTLSVTLYSRNEQLCGVDINVTLNPGVGMSLNLKMFLQDDCSHESHDDMQLADGTFMSAYVAAHENDPLNGRK